MKLTHPAQSFVMTAAFVILSVCQSVCHHCHQACTGTMREPGGQATGAHDTSGAGRVHLNPDICQPQTKAPHQDELAMALYPGNAGYVDSL